MSSILSIGKDGLRTRKYGKTRLSNPSLSAKEREKDLSFAFEARGHPSVLSSHPTTLEVTVDSHLTSRGNCIVAVGAECGLLHLPPGLKQGLSSGTTRGRLTIRVRHYSFSVVGRGSPGLTFTSPDEIVVRKSRFVSDRTLMIHANKAAIDIPRKMVKLLQDPAETVTVEISATV